MLTYRLGGHAFQTYRRCPSSVRTQLSTEFAYACSTAFVDLSLLPMPRNLTEDAAKLGIGVPWRLPIPAFNGTHREAEQPAGKTAADAVGTGTGP